MIAVVFGGLMSMLDTTIVNIALHSLSVRPHSDLADRFGARQAYVASITTFTLASLACGLSTSLPELVAVGGDAGARGRDQPVHDSGDERYLRRDTADQGR